MSNLRLEGKVAIITGGASGIGAAATRLFVEQGASVVIADIQEDLALQLISSLNDDKVSFHHCNVKDEKQVVSTVLYALERYGTLDIMFSNAGILGPMTSILDLDIEGLDNVLATNVRGMAAMIKHAARAMVDRNIKGSIICTCSVTGCIGGAGPLAYSTSKHAVVGLVKSACGELGARGIRVNCISPSGVATPMATPMACKQGRSHPEGLGGLQPGVDFWGRL